MKESPVKKFILKLERSPQHDFIDRVGFGVDQTSAVKSILDSFFVEHPTQKVRLTSCIEIIA